MFKKILLILLICFHFDSITFAQNEKEIKNSDTFFASIPLQQSFEKWIEYIKSNPHLGIDSVTERGTYSSFKTGIKSHFPFPDTVPVKILTGKEIFSDISPAYRPDDTVKVIMIGGLFKKDSDGKKSSAECYKSLLSELKQYYRKINDFVYEYDSTDHISKISKGISRDFPDIYITKPRSDYSADYNYVILLLVSGKWKTDFVGLKIVKGIFY